MIGSMVVFESKGKAVLKPLDVQEPKAGQALLETEYSVVSAGTERANLLNLPNTSNTFPYHPGYSGVGRVTAIGEGVDNVAVGNRVLMSSTSHRSHSIKDATKLLTVDDAVDPLDAAFVEIGAMGLQGVRKLRLELGESAMVIGLGILGIFATQTAALNGAIPVIVSDFDKKRRDLALNLGADYAFSPDEKDLPEKIKELTNGGVNGIVEVTGIAAALTQAMTFVAREGRISLAGCTRIPDANMDFYQYIHKPGVTLIGAHTYVRPKFESRPGYWTNRDDYRALLAFMAAGRLKARPIISEVVSPEKAPEIYNRLAEMQQPPVGIVFDWGRIK